jgi:hypothetical protein
VDRALLTELEIPITYQFVKPRMSGRTYMAHALLTLAATAARVPS